MRIARELIDPDADKVVRRLSRHGHKAYLVGGCVRDLLLGRTPKDFDVATSATPKEIKALFRNCRIIGRRFRLAHIFFGGKIIETSTFRANPREGEDGSSGELLIRRDNVFGTATEDARRRDFRINGLFYDVEAEDVIDHVHGLADLEARIISTIGDPDVRFQEDPVRMMRAIKFAARLGFSIEPASYGAITRHRETIRKCAAPRVLEELYRLLRGGAARRSIELLVETGIAEILSTTLAKMYREPEIARAEDEAAWAATWADDDSRGAGNERPDPRPKPAVERQIDPLPLSWLDASQVAERRAQAWRMLDALDVLKAKEQEVSSSLVIASLVATFVMPDLIDEALRPLEANERVVEILAPLADELRIARRDGERARQILLAQRRLAPGKRRRGKPMALVRRDYFADALTLYATWAEVTGRDPAEVDYWRNLAEGMDDGERPRKRRRRRRGGRRRRRTPRAASSGDESGESEAGTAS